MDPASKLALDALHREAQIRAQEKAEAEGIAMRIAHEKAVEAANLQRAQMEQWRRDAHNGR